MSVVWPASLVREVSERRAIFVIGSGFSKSALPTLPDWPSLLENICPMIPIKARRSELTRMIRYGRLLDAAELAVTEIGLPDIHDHIRETFRIRPTPESDIYSDLLKIDPKIIATTNYDEFIERNFERLAGGHSDSHLVRKQDHGDLLADISSPDRLILKPHGCVTDLSTIVLERTSYFSLKRKFPGFFKTMTAAFSTNTLVFLGYSIGDPDIQLILEDSHSFTNSSRPHYALMSKVEHPSLKRSLRQGYNVEVLEYAKGKHEQMAASLLSLRNEVEAKRATLGIT